MNADEIANQLSSRGFVTVEHSLPAELRVRLDLGCRDSAEFPFAPSCTGRGTSRQPNASVRGDVISWLDDAKDADHAYLILMEDLRAVLNERLYLGLHEYEGHYAIYAAGTHYEKQLDSFAGQKNRMLSTVVYLDEQWAEADGGELLLYGAHDRSPPKDPAKVAPKDPAAKRPRQGCTSWPKDPAKVAQAVRRMALSHSPRRECCPVRARLRESWGLPSCFPVCECSKKA